MHLRRRRPAVPRRQGSSRLPELRCRWRCARERWPRCRCTPFHSPSAAALWRAESPSALDALLATAATDCFLFAQIVGHVTPGSQADGDTLVAHRLARARADTVRAALARAGVPVDEVATTWDRAFGTREPRATLWLFERPLGEDCAGTALPGAPARAVVTATTGCGRARTRAQDERLRSLGACARNPYARRRSCRGQSRRHSGYRFALGCPWSRSGRCPRQSAVELEPAPGIHLPRPQLGTGEAAAVSPNPSGPSVAAPPVQLAQWTASEALPDDPALGMPSTETPEPQAGPASGPIGSADAASGSLRRCRGDRGHHLVRSRQQLPDARGQGGAGRTAQADASGGGLLASRAGGGGRRPGGRAIGG